MPMSLEQYCRELDKDTVKNTHPRYSTMQKLYKLFVGT